MTLVRPSVLEFTVCQESVLFWELLIIPLTPPVTAILFFVACKNILVLHAGQSPVLSYADPKQFPFVMFCNDTSPIIVALNVANINKCLCFVFPSLLIV
jgi:hypothetical protein